MLFSDILSWFVDENIVERILHGDDKLLIEEHEVETRPELVEVVKSVINVFSDKGEWACAVCCHNLVSANSLCCDSCLEWFHLKCVGLKQPPKRSVWFCRKCYHAATM